MTRTTREFSVAAILVAAGLTASSAAAAAGPEWIKQFGTDIEDQAWSVATGPDGTVHVSGDVSDGSTGFENAFLSTFDRNGLPLWRRQPAVQNGLGWVATDSRGNVYLAGQQLFDRPGKGFTDAALVKFDPAGKPLWRRLPGTRLYDTATDVAVSSDDHVYVVGMTAGSFGGPKHGSLDIFILKFDADGRYVWKRQFGTQWDEYAAGVATDAAGNAYVVGNIYSGSDPHTFLSKWDANGNEVWRLAPVDPDFYAVSDVAVDRDGNVCVAGSIIQPVGYGADGYLVKLDPAGTTLWRRKTDATGDTLVTGVATDSGGNIVITGYTSEPLAGSYRGMTDVFVFKFDGSGTVLWKDQQGGRLDDYGAAVAVDADDNVYVAGGTAGALGLRPVRGGSDGLLIKYGPDGPQ